MQSESLANGPEGRTVWDFVDWRKASRIVTNLRQRIFKAARANDHRKVRSLQKLMLRSRSNILMSVRRAALPRSSTLPLRNDLGRRDMLAVLVSPSLGRWFLFAAHRLAIAL